MVLVIAIGRGAVPREPKQTVAWQQTGSVATQPDAAGEPGVEGSRSSEHGVHAAAAAPATPEDELAAIDHHGKHADA